MNNNNIEEVMSNFKNYIQNEKELSQNTFNSYISDINQFAEYLKEYTSINIFNANKTIIITYLMYLQKQGRATSTISRNLASLKSFYQYLFYMGFIKEDPTFNLHSPKSEKKIPNILTSSEIELLLSQPKEDNFKGARDKAMLELMYATGIRVSELVALNIEDFNQKIGYILVGRDTESERTISIENKTRKYILNYLENYRYIRLKNKTENALFINYKGERLTRQGLWKVLKYYVRKININKNITPHTLRQSFTVHLLQSGVSLKSAQQILGHADITTTQYYSFITISDSKKDDNDNN